MRPTYYICNAFSNTTNGGNPAAVCLLETALDLNTMQQIAADINLPATAFCLQKDHSCYDIRWFSPTSEIQLCGHATLAAAQLIFSRPIPLEEIHFMREDVTLICRKQNNSVRLQLPHNPTISIELPRFAEQAVGPGIIDSAKTVANNGFILLEYKSIQSLEALKPDFETITQSTLYGIIATCWVGTKLVDTALRVFVPQYGYDEDQATGSAQPVLWDYWHRKTLKHAFSSMQYSNRQAHLHVENVDGKLWLEGQCVVLKKCL